MAKSEVVTSEKVYVRTRLAFVRVDKPKPFDEGGEPRYECSFLIDPSEKAKGKTPPAEVGMGALKNIVTTVAKISKQKWGKTPKAVLRVASEIGIPGVKYDPKAKDDGIVFECLYNGDTKEYDGFPGNWVLATHNKQKPAVVNRAGEPVLPGEEEFPFSGSYGRGSVTFWTQDNKYGKRVGVNLRGVQWMRTGEAFSAAAIDPEGEFDGLEDDDGPVDESGAEDSPFGDE